MNIHEILGSTPSDKEHLVRFGTDLDSDYFFHISIIERQGVLGIKYATNGKSCG